MAPDEPFTTRTVIVTTAIGLAAFGLLYVAGAGLAPGTRLVSSWFVATTLTILLFVGAGVVLQVRARRRQASV